MLPTNPTKKSRNYKALSFLAAYSTTAAFLLFISSKSNADEWVLTPSMQVDLIYSDNIRLAPNGDPDKFADFVTRLTPGIYSKYTSRRFDSEIDYRLSNVIYTRNTEANRSLHNLAAKNTAEIVDDFFYFDGNVRMQQQNQNILAPQGDQINDTGNLQNIRQYSVSPYIRHNFADVATTEARYARIWNESDASNTFFNSTAHAYNGSLVSGPDFRTFQWGLNYTRQDIDFELRPDKVRLETGIANVRYYLTRRFAITGTGGYENNTFGGGLGTFFGVNRPKGPRWSAGFLWIPTNRTTIEASAGKRFFGDTYRANLSHRMRFMALNASYKEDINSAWNILNTDAGGVTATVLTDLFTAQAPPGTDPALIAALVQSFISELGLPPNLAFAQGFLTNRFFLEKNFESSVAFNFTKNTLLFRIFHTTRKPLDQRPLLDTILGTGFQLANVRQKGVSTLWSWPLGPRTRFSANFLYNHLYFPSLSRTDRITLYTAAVSRELTQNIFGLLSYRRVRRRSSDPSATYVENRFTASVNMRF